MLITVSAGLNGFQLKLLSTNKRTHYCVFTCLFVLPISHSLSFDSNYSWPNLLCAIISGLACQPVSPSFNAKKVEKHCKESPFIGTLTLSLFCFSLKNHL